MVDRLSATSAQIEFQAASSPRDKAQAAAHLPVWRNGRRPKFWPDLAVRELLTASHRQMTIGMCLDLCRRQLGDARTPSSSAVHRYWMVLDQARGRVA